jgi:hypothetical protein
MSNIFDVRCRKGAGDLSVDVIIGQRQLGIYTLTLFDSTGRNGAQVGTGSNGDDPFLYPDSYVLGRPADLDARILGWVVTISDPSASGRVASTGWHRISN